MAERPKRIQRRRTKGWRMPEGAIYVGRPGRWGNSVAVHGRATDIRVGDVYDWPTITSYFDGARFDVEFLIVNGLVTITREIAAAMFRLDLVTWNHDTRTRWLAPLRGHDLVCWCPLDPAVPRGRPARTGEPMTPTPEPRELWERAGRDPERYRELLREHGALVDVEPCASCGERFRHRHSRAGAIVRVDVFGHDELRRRDG